MCIRDSSGSLLGPKSNAVTPPMTTISGKPRPKRPFDTTSCPLLFLDALRAAAKFLLLNADAFDRLAFPNVFLEDAEEYFAAAVAREGKDIDVNIFFRRGGVRQSVFR